MSAILKLSSSYASTFWECTKFAISPYTNTFKSLAKKESGETDVEHIAIAGLIVGVLTFVVPILPVIATFTFTLAAIAMLITVASMFITYPIAFIADAFNQDTWNASESGYSPAY